MAKKSGVDPLKLEQILREHGLSFPEVHEDFPWGERAMKVKKKGFVFMRVTPEEISFSVKLPQSNDFALSFPFAQPTGYGMGKSGWVTCRFAKGDEVPVDILLAWMTESYKAVAPKKLAATIS